MRIASFNIKHRLLNKNNYLSNEVYKVILDNNIDVLCTQEIPKSLAKSFQKVINGYNVVGDSRYRRYLKHLPYDEKNPIIAKNEILKTRTVRYKNKVKNIKEFFRYLKNIPILPRIATIAIIKVNNKKDICIINTHLDYKLSIIQKKQLNELLELIEEYKTSYDIVLTGDFNMDEKDKHFSDFIDTLKIGNISKVNVEGFTWRSKKGKEEVLDYIFVSDNLSVKSFGIIKSNNLSDHEIVYVDLSI